ncbi:hypothetical protein NDU88_007490 [Pleurodeles waltl]|uniref:Uncharacterized protein n=1 Tax=Pleurodeles waltl TaxID=8319 RepID=A0AAV7PMT4_PLEWA|nr:hypothetical protein NDU88_007490 [Pleurodeles waltl]
MTGSATAGVYNKIRHSYNAVIAHQPARTTPLWQAPTSLTERTVGKLGQDGHEDYPDRAAAHATLALISHASSHPYELSKGLC